MKRKLIKNKKKMFRTLIALQKKTKFKMKIIEIKTKEILSRINTKVDADHVVVKMRRQNQKMILKLLDAAHFVVTVVLFVVVFQSKKKKKK